MSESVVLRAFPDGRAEALALLYLQNQDLSSLSPIQIHEKYWKAYNEICKDYKERKDYLKNL